MNCYINIFAEYYCLNPINSNSTYSFHNNDDLFYLICHKDNSRNLIHRVNGPAENNSFGNKIWYFMGKYHRIDGPAIEYYNGEKRWFYHGKKINCKSTEEFLKIIKMKAFL